MLDRPTTITGELSETQPFCVACRHASCFARPLCNARFARLIACCCSLCSPPRLLITVHISLARQPTPGLLASLARSPPRLSFASINLLAALACSHSLRSPPRLACCSFTWQLAPLAWGLAARFARQVARFALAYCSLRSLACCSLACCSPGSSPESRVCCSFRQHCLACPRWKTALQESAILIGPPFLHHFTISYL